MNSATWLILVCTGISLVLVSALVWVWLLYRMQQASFWEYQIRAFEDADRRQPPNTGAILFTGSSSIRYWPALGRDMAPVPVLNRGFGGSHLSHVIDYAERIIIPYRPQ